jgi:hypothetical protein
MHCRRREAEPSGDDVDRGDEDKSSDVAEGGSGVWEDQNLAADSEGGTAFVPV